MGILDDAIREHLDLKRQHGADEGEVSRKESEALGPVKKQWADQESEGESEQESSALGGAAAPEAEGELAATQQGQVIPRPDPAEEAAGSVDEADASEPQSAPPEPPPPAEPESPPPAEPAPDPIEPPTPPPPPPPPAAEPPAGGLYDVEADPGAGLAPGTRRPTREPDSWLEPTPPPEPAEPDEDVLEETPEFLEETPEHDRLWFEQKPPKEFDFGD